MATQNSGHTPINFSISSPFQRVRLMEVPDDLVSVITSQSTKALKFKSARISNSSTSQGRKEEEIMHLCSNDKAWAVKQVSTSNSVYLIRPTDVVLGSGSGDGGEDGDLEAASRSAVTAVAQVGNFLELHPVKIDETAVERALVELTPVHHPEVHGEELDHAFEISQNRKGGLILRALLDDVAAPDDVVRRVCTRLCVFETHEFSGNYDWHPCYLPSTRALLEVWMKIVEECAIKGIKLDGDISEVCIVSLFSEVDAKPDIAEVMFRPEGFFDLMGLTEQNSQGQRRLRPQEMCRFIAGLMLSSHLDREMNEDEFVNKWTNLVPSSFFKHCTVESLTSTPSSLFETKPGGDGGNTVRWTGKSVAKGVVLAPALFAVSDRAEIATGGDEAAAKSTTAAPSAVDKKRKWHEKFGAQRNAKK